MTSIVIFAPPSQATSEEKLIMKIRIAMLFVVASLFASTVAAHAAITPVDPDKAPIASVDRFSDKAAPLQLRTPENHLPGANKPVDFDSGPFITQGLSPLQDGADARAAKHAGRAR
jgi:hypothetical protein